MTRPVVVDFETEGIAARPEYPPRPVGVSIWYPDAAAPVYRAWGHPSGNNSSFEKARAELGRLWNREVLFHNAKFDLDVARTHMGIPLPHDPDKVHDTMFLLYLYDPHAPSLSLKPSAERLLNLPPTEQEALRQYLAGQGFGGKDWGAHISKAPGELVGAYADGDTRRTGLLFDSLFDHINKKQMVGAYRREQRLLPILIDNETDGIRVDLEGLERDLVTYERAFARITDQLLQIIGDCNPDSSGELAAALLRSGSANEADFARTPTGRLSTSKASIDAAVKHPGLRQILAYRGNLKTILTTFMRPWIAMARSLNGRLHPQFNQVKGDDYGTRTGRLSSSNPNFQNVPTEFTVEPPEGFPPLPAMRRYILPDEGHILVPRDFASQEFRVAAHFAEGKAAEIYRTDPKADFHAVVSDILKHDAGLDLPRKKVKIIGFTLLYGGGLAKLAESLGVDKSTASRIKAHYFQALPGLKELMESVSSRGRAGDPVRTWGGRYIYAEPPKMVDGRWWTFEYKLLNYLIQGSAADQTKEAVIQAGYRTAHRRFLMTVHDENVYSIDPEHLHTEIEEIRAAMDDQPGWDVPFDGDTEIGPNWHDLKPYEPPGA